MSHALLESPSMTLSVRSPHRNRSKTGKLLSAREERSLAEKARQGDQRAIERLVLANQGLIGSVASSYLRFGVSFEDLMQEGVQGLLRACTDFNPEIHNVRFSTYATYWIRNAIQNAIANHGAMIRLPDYMFRLRLKYRRMINDLASEAYENNDRREPRNSIRSSEELASRLGVSMETLALVRKSDIERTQFHQGNNSGSIAIEETIPDKSIPLFDLESAEELQCLREGIEQLSPHEAWVIRRRFGLEEENDELKNDEAEPKTVYWIARNYHLSPITVKRLEATAIVKLREYMRRRVGDTEA